MLQYSGGTIINRTFTPSTRLDLVTNITQAISDAGWTTIAGTPGAGSDVTLETLAANQGQKIRFRFLDPGANNCAQITMKDVAGTQTSQIGAIVPSNTWRVWASPYWFGAFMTTSANATTSRSSVFGGTFFVPSFLTAAASVGFMNVLATTDADAINIRVNWRRSIRTYQFSANTIGGWSAIWNGTLKDIAAGSAGGGSYLTLCPWQGGTSGGGDDGYRWEDGSTYPNYEPFIAFDVVGSEAKLKGQLYDAVVVNGSMVGETTFSLDSLNWLAITDAAQINQVALATLAVVIP